MEDKKFNVLDPQEYLANNPFMQHNHMYITEIGTETSEIRTSRAYASSYLQATLA